VESGIRRCVLARFPYALIYGIEEESIVAIAVLPFIASPVTGRIDWNKGVTRSKIDREIEESLIPERKMICQTS